MFFGIPINHVSLCQRPSHNLEIQYIRCIYHRYIKTFIPKSTSLVPRLLRNPNCLSLISASKILYILLWIIMKNTSKVWCIRLIVLYSVQPLGLFFLGRGIQPFFWGELLSSINFRNSTGTVAVRSAL